MLHTAQMRSDKVLGLVGVAADPDFTETLVWPALDEATKEKVMAEGIAGEFVYAGGGGRACGYLWMGGEWV